MPYGLVRFGVAPDHQSLKAVSKRYDTTADTAGVDFIGNVTVGRDVSIAELLDLYDAVVLAIGAPHDRKLGIAGEDLPGVVGSAAFVGWYNGHPEFAHLHPPLGGTHAAVIQTLCATHTKNGDRYTAGLGFYAFLRFHVDSTKFRRWNMDPAVLALCPPIVHPSDIASVGQPLPVQTQAAETKAQTSVSQPHEISSPHR